MGDVYRERVEENKAWKREIKQGTKLFMGCGINTSSPLVCELVASMGFDFLLIDTQHSAVDPEKLRTLLACAKAGGAKTIVRVGGHQDRIGIQQAFDLGANGILVPCVRSAADVRQAVSYSKYPTKGPGGGSNGSRSIFLNIRPQFPGGFQNLFSSVMDDANDETIVACQIETKEAFEDIEEICKIEGLDIALIGPGDLAADLGLMREVGAPECWSDERFIAAEKKIADTANANGVIAGYWNGDIEGKTPLGFRFMIVDGDITAMQNALHNKLTSLKEKRELLKLG